MSQITHTIHKSFLYFLKYVIILTVVALVPVPLLSFFGDQAVHQKDYHPLFQYYNSYNIQLADILKNTYSNIYISQKQSQINQQDIDNTILYADYLNHLLHQEEIPVVRKVINNQKTKGQVQSIQAIAIQYEKTTQMPDFKQIKSSVESLIPLPIMNDDPRQWIILALNCDQKVAQTQIKRLAKLYPSDNFLVISKTPFKIHKKLFQSSVPKFNHAKAQQIISQSLKITVPQSKILLNHFSNSLWQIKQSGNDQNVFSIASLLDESYKNIEEASSSVKKALQQLCKTGKIKAKNLDLTNFGVAYNNKYQWKDSLVKLNYEIQSQQTCQVSKKLQKTK